MSSGARKRTKTAARTEGDYYRDGVNQLRCRECLALKSHRHDAECGVGQHEERQRHMMDLLPTNTLLYVSDICPKQEKTKDETKKIIEIVFKLQPFTAEMATLMGIFDRLFDKQQKPLDDVLSMAIGLKNVPLYNMSWRLSADAPDALDLSDVKVSSTLHVRRDKEGPVYAATFTASVLYPSANDLLTILHAYTESRYVSFEASTQTLPLQGETVDGEVIKPGDELRPGVLAQ